MAPDTLLRLADVQTRVGLGRSTIYKLIGLHHFPGPIRIGSASRWSLHEIAAWIEDQKSGDRSHA